MPSRSFSVASQAILLGLVVACSGDPDSPVPSNPGDATGSVGGGSTTGGTGGSDGTSGASDTGGSTETPAGGAGGTGTGNPVVTTEQLDALKTKCEFGYAHVEVTSSGNDVGSLDPLIDLSAYDQQTGEFTMEMEKGDRLKVRWQAATQLPDYVDFIGSIEYRTNGGASRAFCIEGRLLDAYVPVPNQRFHPFISESVTEANPDGTCTNPRVDVTVSGCFSEGYYD